MTIRAFAAAMAFAGCVLLGWTFARAETRDAAVARGAVRCAGVPRPGLAAQDASGAWSGLELELCRAVAVAAIGPEGRARFMPVEAGLPVAPDGFDVLFLTFDEMALFDLAGRLVPGPVAYDLVDTLLVPAVSPAKTPADLAGKAVCTLTGSASDAALDAYFGERGLAIERRAFSEDGEMADAFRVGRCDALAGEAPALAEIARDDGVRHLAMRVMASPLRSTPLRMAVPTSADARWAAIVDWTFATLRSADRAETRFSAGGARAVPVPGGPLGLRPTWQSDLAATFGGYAAMVGRTLGPASSTGSASAR